MAGSAFWAARNGTGEAWLQHVTALALVPLSLYFVWLLLDLLHMDYNGVRTPSAREQLSIAAG